MAGKQIAEAQAVAADVLMLPAVFGDAFAGIAADVAGELALEGRRREKPFSHFISAPALTSATSGLPRAPLTTKVVPGIDWNSPATARSGSSRAPTRRGRAAENAVER
jgi:hypothetical protein